MTLATVIRRADLATGLLRHHLAVRWTTCMLLLQVLLLQEEEEEGDGQCRDPAEPGHGRGVETDRVVEASRQQAQQQGVQM